ncbi:MAG: hypothetical protein ACI83B_002586 [Sediminicola sp.]|jgi:hypothetical protein
MLYQIEGIMPKSSQLSIKLMSEPQKVFDKHFIFIHGLSGDPIQTWKTNNVKSEFWPNWLAEVKEGIAIWTIGYPADKVKWANGQAMHVTDRGSSIYNALIAIEEFQQGELCFIGHSMGGLLIKQILVEADTDSKSNQVARDLINRISKVCFIGTPHAGSFISSMCKAISFVSKPTLATYSLGSGDPNLRDLNKRYKAIAKENEVEHLVLFETQEFVPYKVLSFVKFLVVSPSSADPGVDCKVMPIDADHEMICKPSSTESQVFQQLKVFLNADGIKESSNLRIENKIDLIIESTTSMNESLSILDKKNQDDSHLLFDNEIIRKVTQIRHQRFFGNFDAKTESSNLLNSVLDGNLKNGSANVKTEAIAWCIRLLSLHDTDLDLDSCLKSAEQLYKCEEIDVAYFFINSKKSSNFEQEISNFISSSSKLKRDAALIVYSNLNGVPKCLEWIKSTKLPFEYFGQDGLISLFNFALNQQEWELTKKLTKYIDSNNMEESPALYSRIAISYLSEAILDPSLKGVIIQSIPLGNFPLADDDVSLLNRRNAVNYFNKAAIAAKTFELKEACEFFEDFSLWLRVQDTMYQQEAEQEIALSMHGDAYLMLRRFSLAIKFLNQKVNLKAVEEELDSLTAKTFGKSFIAGVARYAYLLNLTKYSNASNILDYLNKHKEQLQLVAPKSDLLGFEIECLINNQQVGQAEDKIKLLKENSDDESLISRYENLILEAKGGNKISLATEQFNNTDNISDLNLLVHLLQKSNETALFELYSQQIFTRTKTKENAEKLLDSKQRLKKFHDIEVFFMEYSDFQSKSPLLRYHWAWHLFRKGDIDGCLKAIEDLQLLQRDADIISLKTQCLIAKGNWKALSPVVEGVWEHKENFSVQLLLQTANLASVINVKRARDIIEFIAQKEKKNPNVLLSAYSVATNMGWENEENVSLWLNDAIQLSGSDGPIKTMSLEMIADSLTDWRENENYILDLFNDMKAPAFMVANSLNRALSNYYISPALSNSSNNDLRFNQPIPAFTSFRPILSIESSVVGFDATTILTLGFLNELGSAINYFDLIYIPHSLLSWLFNEVKETAFHQPSRISRAKEIRDSITDNEIEVVGTQYPDDVELALEVGDEIAVLLEAANASSEKKSYVVRSLPIPKVGTYIQESADLGKLTSLVIECNHVVKALKLFGYINEQEENLALDFLVKHEEVMVDDVFLEQVAELYFDDLSISYFQTIGLLDNLLKSNFKVIVHKRTEKECNSLIKYEKHCSKVHAALDSIRSSLEEGISKNKVLLSSLNKNTQRTYKEELSVLAELFDSDENVDGIVIDDRFCNQHPNFELNNKTVPTYTSVDILNTLFKNEVLSELQYFLSIIKLRCAHYHLIPITKNELDFWISKALVQESGISETFELKSIRQYLIKLKMSNSIQLPRDAQWIIDLTKTISHSLKSLWVSDLSEDEKIAKSNWLYDILDYRGWAPFHQTQAGEELAKNGMVMKINSLLIRSVDNIQMEVMYWKWLDKHVIEPLKSDEPAVYRAVVELAKQEISRQIHDDSLWNRISRESE